MNVLVVGDILKDVYLNLDERSEKFELDKNQTPWLNLSFDSSEHHFYNRTSNFGGAAVTFEVLTKMGIETEVNAYDIKLQEDGLLVNTIIDAHRYIFITDEKVCYFVPTTHKKTTFQTPTKTPDYLFIDRSANLDTSAISSIISFLDASPNTKLILYLSSHTIHHLSDLITKADLIFFENHNNPSHQQENVTTPNPSDIDPQKLITISDSYLSYLNITEPLSISRANLSTHLSLFSIATATILGSFINGYSVEDSLKMARANIEESKLNYTLSEEELKTALESKAQAPNLELIAANLLLKPKGILAADESGGSIKKKFASLSIDDTYENRRIYRNIFFTTPTIEQFVNGVILFEETTKQNTDTGQNIVDYLISKQIIPGIKVDQGLEKFDHSIETYTKGLDGLSNRLKNYYAQGLRFAKWRAAFEIRLNQSNEVLTPTQKAIDTNCRILAEYAKECQKANLVPIVEPEVVYDGYYPIDISAKVTSEILDVLFKTLTEYQVNLRACILKVNMVTSGKNYPIKSSLSEIGKYTADTLKNHVPAELAGVVFLSGGQTPEEATDNLAEVITNGPFPWPVTFSFARALQDPALYAWAGQDYNIPAAKDAFLERLKANRTALEQ